MRASTVGRTGAADGPRRMALWRAAIAASAAASVAACTTASSSRACTAAADAADLRESDRRIDAVAGFLPAAAQGDDRQPDRARVHAGDEAGLRRGTGADDRGLGKMGLRLLDEIGRTTEASDHARKDFRGTAARQYCFGLPPSLGRAARQSAERQHLGWQAPSRPHAAAHRGLRHRSDTKRPRPAPARCRRCVRAPGPCR